MLSSCLFLLRYYNIIPEVGNISEIHRINIFEGQGRLLVWVLWP